MKKQKISLRVLEEILSEREMKSMIGGSGNSNCRSIGDSCTWNDECCSDNCLRGICNASGCARFACSCTGGQSWFSTYCDASDMENDINSTCGSNSGHCIQI